MRMRSLMLFAVLALVAGACADDGTDTAGEATQAPMEAVSVAVSSSDLGEILVDGEGLTLYAFLPDEQGDPTCTGGCIENWPPLEGSAEAREGADAAMLGTVEHPSGVTQITYNDWPLYYFANDQGPGDTNGQGAADNWYVIGPDGEPITEGA